METLTHLKTSAGFVKKENKTHSQLVIDKFIIKGLKLTEARIEEGKEIFPNEKEIINIEFELEFYLQQIYDSKEEFDASKFNPNDPILEKQKEYLATLKKSDFKEMFKHYNDFKK